MRTTLLLTLAAAGLFLACRHANPADDKPRIFNKKAEIVFLGGSASWDEDEIIGPLISVAQRSDGSWAGTINNQVIDVNVYSGRAGGSYLTMKWREENGAMIVAGAFQDRPFRFEVFPDRVNVRLPMRSFELPRYADWHYGRGGELKFEGEARTLQPQMPQYGLALLATFLAADAQMRDSSGDPVMPTGNPNP